MTTHPQSLPPGIITADSAYTVREFRLRTGIGDFAWRQLRKAGLRVIEVGKKRYVRGADWLEFLERSAIKSANEQELNDEKGD